MEKRGKLRFKPLPNGFFFWQFTLCGSNRFILCGLEQEKHHSTVAPPSYSTVSKDNKKDQEILKKGKNCHLEGTLENLKK